MEDCSSSISALCVQLRSFCGHLETSCATLRSVVDHRPSSLPSPNLPSLLTTLINRVSLTSQVVGNLESKTTDTISFQELLGHCMEIYKQNEASICVLEDRLKEYGYTYEDFANGNSKEPVIPHVLSDLSLEAKPKPFNSSGEGMISGVCYTKKSSSTFTQEIGQLQSYMYEGPETETGHFGSFYSGTLSLQDLGLSAAGLACLAQEDSSPGVDYNTPLKSFSVKSALQETSWNVLSIDRTAANEDEDTESCTPDHNRCLLKRVEEDEYSSCPTWLKMQISSEDLNAIVDNMCELLAKKVNCSHKSLSGFENYTLDQEDLSTLSAAGTKMKPCLLFLVRLGHLQTGNENGATVYHVVRQ